MKDILQIVGSVAGLGGLALGVFLLLFKQALGKLVFPQLSAAAAERIVSRFMTYCFAVTIVGMILWVVSLWAPRGEATQPTKTEATKTEAAKKEEVQKEKSEQANNVSGSAKELVSLLDSRFKNIIDEIEAVRKKPGELKAAKEVIDIDATEKALTKLHGEIKEAYEKGELVKAHELINDFQDKVGTFYAYPITLTAKRRYVNPPNPGQDRDYDEMRMAILRTYETSREKYPGPEVMRTLPPRGKK